MVRSSLAQACVLARADLPIRPQGHGYLRMIATNEHASSRIRNVIASSAPRVDGADGNEAVGQGNVDEKGQVYLASHVDEGAYGPPRRCAGRGVAN